MGRPHNVCRGRPQGVGKGSPVALHIGWYGDLLREIHWDVLRTSYFSVLRTSAEDVLRTLLGEVPWRYIEDHMVTSIGRLLGTSSGRPRDVILSSGNSRHRLCLKWEYHLGQYQRFMDIINRS